MHCSCCSAIRSSSRPSGTWASRWLTLWRSQGRQKSKRASIKQRRTVLPAAMFRHRKLALPDALPRRAALRADHWPTHFVYLRAVAEGLDVVESAARYLGTELRPRSPLGSPAGRERRARDRALPKASPDASWACQSNRFLVHAATADRAVNLSRQSHPIGAALEGIQQDARRL